MTSVYQDPRLKFLFMVFLPPILRIGLPPPLFISLNAVVQKSDWWGGDVLPPLKKSSETEKTTSLLCLLFNLVGFHVC